MTTTTLLAPAYYYDLYADVDGKLQVIDTDFPVWLSEQDFEDEWTSLGRSLYEYRELRYEMEKGDLVADDNLLTRLMFDPVQYHKDVKRWNNFRRDYIDKTKDNLISRYDTTLAKHGKWKNTVVDTTIKYKKDDDPFLNQLRNLNHCTHKLKLNDILQLPLDCKKVKLVAIPKDLLSTTKF